MTRRRLLWILLSVALVVAAGVFIAAGRKEADEFAFLKPYITEDKKNYMAMDRAPGDDAAYFQIRELTLKCRPLSDFTKLAQAKFNSKNGWTGSMRSDYRVQIYSANKLSASGVSQALLVVERAPDSGATTVSYQHVLTKFEVFMVRLRNVGHDPFKRPRK